MKGIANGEQQLQKQETEGTVDNEEVLGHCEQTTLKTPKNPPQCLWILLLLLLLIRNNNFVHVFVIFIAEFVPSLVRWLRSRQLKYEIDLFLFPFLPFC